MQPLAGRGLRPREVGVPDDVRDPGRLAARPDAAGQPDPGGERGPPAQGHELLRPADDGDVPQRRRSGARRPAGRPATGRPPTSPGSRRSPAGARARRRRAGATPPGRSDAVYWTARRRSARRRSRSMRFERRRVPPDQRREEDDVRQHEQRQPHDRVRRPPLLGRASSAQPTTAGIRIAAGQQPTRHDAAGAGAADDRHQPAVGPRAEDADAQDRERDRACSAPSG